LVPDQGEDVGGRKVEIRRRLVSTLAVLKKENTVGKQLEWVAEEPRQLVKN
jgi:hypothetical protein